MLFDKKNCEDDHVDPLYKLLLDKEEDIRCIESKYECYKSYLDPDFEKLFYTEHNFLPKLWELDICDVLTQSKYAPYFEPTCGNGPDFCFTKILHDKNLYLENVCPNRPQKEKEHLIENSSFYVESSNPPHAISTLSGVDERIISRFASSIHDKAKKFKEKYQNTEGHYRVLCVLGSRLGRWKVELNNSEFAFNTKGEFEYCILGQPIAAFSKDPDEEIASVFSYRSFSIPKGQTTLNVGQHEDLSVFDAIVFRDLLPFVSWSSSKTYSIIYREDASQELKNLLDELFHK